MENAASVSRTETNEISILRDYTLLRVTSELFLTHLSVTLAKEEVKNWKSQTVVKNTMYFLEHSLINSASCTSSNFRSYNSAS